MKNINIGIDLGTTNSGIAEYKDGKVILHRNPINFHELLPSVVSFRKNKILIGDKAKERVTIDPDNTFSSFKRKMGTDENFYSSALEKNVSPIDLSSLILKELASFVVDFPIQSAVITIPASFDTMQSNATKKAGYEAGIKEVALLQEPIAACVAYSNSQNLDLSAEENWLVYDFGGGTFDITLAKVSSRNLEVIDHLGNNFLGGLDFDNLIVEKIICKYLEKENPSLDNLWKRMTSNENNTLMKLYYELLFKAEEIKKELSLKQEAYLEVDNEELAIFSELKITRQEFNEIIKSKFEETFQLLTSLLDENNFVFDDISRIIMVGGTTYIPFIREELSRRTNIKIDTSIDPSTAVIIGAAYFAGSKTSTLREEIQTEIQTIPNSVEFDLAYENQSNDAEELLMVNFKSAFEGYFRITRTDGGFDTGMVHFKNKIAEFVPLLMKIKNNFKIQLFNQNHQLVSENNDIIISHGQYNIAGQPLPNDIAIELDGKENTYLEIIFKKNDILPLTKKIYKTTSKTILKNSDDKLTINVLEGDVRNSIAANLIIGCLEISGKNINFDIVKGLDIEICFNISESRDIQITVQMDAIGLSLNQVFNPTEKNVDSKKTSQQIKNHIDLITDEISELNANELTTISELKNVQNELINLYGKSIEYQNDELTEIKYQIEDSKRALIQRFDQILGNKLLAIDIEKYHQAKNNLKPYLDVMTSFQKESYEKIIKNENSFLLSGNKNLIVKKRMDLDELNKTIYLNSDDYLSDLFYNIKHNIKLKEKIIDNKLHELYLQKGETAIESKNIVELKHILNALLQNFKNLQKEKTTNEVIKNRLGLE